MKKKLLTLATTAVLASTMVMSAFASETLKSDAWWTFTGVGQDYELSGDDSVTLTIETKEDTKAFTVELYNAGTEADNDGYYFTTGSDGSVWFAELAGSGTITSNPQGENNGVDPGKFVAGHTYEITVSRAGNDYTIVYYDVDAATETYKMAGTADVEFPSDLYVHVIAQVGEITVEQKADEPAPADPEPADPAEPAPESGDTAVILPVVLMAMVAAGVVVVSRKKNIA